MPAATASVRVTGGSGAQREAFRERVRWLLVRDADAPRYEEQHEPEALVYRFEVEAGIPFPALVEASREFGELLVAAEWPRHGRARAGRVVFSAGLVVEKVDLEAEAQGGA